ncbi:hypothetical protein FI667_g14457, partial [Globisporangium splendens]
MKLSYIVALAASLSAMAAAAAPAETPKTQTVYAFDRASAAGIEGAITIRHGDDAEAAWILASLDFRDLDLDGVRTSDPQCKALKEIKQFQYHIHVHWNASPASRTSDAFAGCGKPVTGNHYDPDKACGPSSEFAGTPACDGKAAKYACTPETYAKDPNVCEKGDLSGKLGNLMLGDNAFVNAEWKDPHFPSASERKPHWSIVLHAVCGTATPRIACAVGLETEQSAAGGDEDKMEKNTEVYDAGVEWIDELRG